MAENENREKSDLEAQLKDLICKREANDKKKREILEEIRKLKKDRPTTEDLTVTFVKEIEKANQYFEFKDYLEEKTELVKHDSDKYDILKLLIKEKVHWSFSKLDIADIMDALQDRIVDLIIEQNCKESVQSDSNITTLLKEDGAPLAEKEDECARLDPLMELVYRMRNGYTLKEDPMDELRGIMEKDRLFYDQIFIWKLFENNSATKLMVRNLPDDFSEDDVKNLLVECGDVVSVNFTSPGLFGKHACVTFRDAESVKLAPTYMRQKLCNTAPCPEPGEHEPDFPSDTEYKVAMEKYGEFRRNPSILLNKRKNADIKTSPVKKPKVDISSTSDGAFLGSDDMQLE